jgi:hypothetical protein
LVVENVHDFVDVLFSEAVFVAVFDEAFAGVNHKNGVSASRILFIDNNYAGGDACTVE